MEENQTALLYLIHWMTGHFGVQISEIQDRQEELALTQQLIREDIIDIRNSLSSADEINAQSDKLGQSREKIQQAVDQAPEIPA